MEQTNKRRAIQVAIAILTGLVLWLYVDSQVTTQTTMEVEGVPVVFKGEDTTLANKNLMLLSGYDTTIDLVLEGPRQILWNMDESEIRCVADTSAIHVAGQQQLEWTPQYPTSVPGGVIKVKDASAYSVRVTVGELYTKEVPVEYEVNGEPAAGFFTGELEADTDMLVLRAQREDLLNVSYAKVEINISGATKTIIQTAEYTLYDYNDVPVVNPDIRSATTLVQVTLPIRTTKIVPLEVELVGIPEETPEAVRHTITPRRVELVGEASTLDAISSILLDKIYVEDLGRSQTFTYEVQPPVGTTLRKGAVQAEVTITVEGTEEKTLTVESIQTANAPEGLTVQKPENLQVTVWGLESKVAEVEPEHLTVHVDLSAIALPGTYTIPATITLKDHPDVTIKGNYNVMIIVTDPNAENDQGDQGDQNAPGNEEGQGDQNNQGNQGGQGDQNETLPPIGGNTGDAGNTGPSTTPPTEGDAAETITPPDVQGGQAGGGTTEPDDTTNDTNNGGSTTT